MNTSMQLVRYQLRNVVRGRAVLVYGLLLLAVSWGLVRFAGSPERALLSLGNVVLIVVPLVGLVFGTVFFYDAREFNELVLSQPVGRTPVYRGLYWGLTLPLIGVFVLAVIPPLLMVRPSWEVGVAILTLTMGGVLLTAVFVAIATWLAVRFDEPIKGLGSALVVWFFFVVLYDALVLMVAQAFSAYPLERPMLALMMLNPVDLARILLLMQLDASALMGYTGAVFRSFFEGTMGPLLAFGTLLVWISVPLLLGHRAFQRRDF